MPFKALSKAPKADYFTYLLTSPYGGCTGGGADADRKKP